MNESTSPSPAETSLALLRSALDRARSRRTTPFEPTQLLRWEVSKDGETTGVTEPEWVARLAKMVELNSDATMVEVPRLSKPPGGHPWERVVRRHLRHHGATVGDLAACMDTTPQRIHTLFHFAPLWQSLEPRLSKALGITSFALRSEIEQETRRIAQDRETRRLEQEERKQARARLLRGRGA